MLNDNRKIDYRNGFSFSFLCLDFRFSKWVGYARIGSSKHGAVACLASLLIKLKPLNSVHTSRSAVLRCVRWPGRRLARPVCLLGGRCDCRLFAGQDSVPPTPPSSGGVEPVCSVCIIAVLPLHHPPRRPHQTWRVSPARADGPPPLPHPLVTPIRKR